MKTVGYYLKRWRDCELKLEEFIELIQKEAYNQALEDAVKNAEAKIDVWYDYDDKAYKRGDAIVDKQSILKLKK